MRVVPGSINFLRASIPRRGLSSMTTNATREDLVGIHQYANDAPKITGILKQRYTDFKVNEVDLRGNVVRLTSLEHNQFEEQPKAVEAKPAAAPQEVAEAVPPQPSEAQAAQDTAAKEDEAKRTAEAVAQEVEAAKQLVGDAGAAQLQDFMKRVAEFEVQQSRDLLPDPIFVDSDDDKEKRKAIHDFFKKRVFERLNTETLIRKAPANGQPGESVIKISYLPPKRRRGTRGNRQRQPYPKEWAGGDKEYLQFVLYKDNLETQAVLSLISKFMHIPYSHFGVAGTKDRRASTCQHVTVKKVQPFRMAQQNDRLRGARVGNFAYTRHALHLGGLSGNLFDIILRNVRGSPAEIQLAADALKKSGFINYFGLQRFGNELAPTHEVGILLVRGEWEAAINLIMAPRDGEKDGPKSARELFLKGDLSAANRAMPTYLSAEKAILSTLVGQGATEWVAALRQIPHNMRSLFLHALQSYLWNKAASHRVATYGVEQVQVGDLVLPLAADVQTPEEEELKDQPASKARLADVHIATEEDIASQRYSIEDVVLPLPGSQIKYPANSTADVYTEEAKKLGISLTECSHKVKDFSLTALAGDYRRLLVRPKNMSWSLLLYSHPDQDLGYTDLDAVLGNSKPELEILMPGDSVPEGKLLGLQMCFQLPTSGYATMLIRELLKETTSTTQHRDRSLADQKAAEGGAAVEEDLAVAAK